MLTTVTLVCLPSIGQVSATPKRRRCVICVMDGETRSQNLDSLTSQRSRPLMCFHPGTFPPFRVTQNTCWIAWTLEIRLAACIGDHSQIAKDLIQQLIRCPRPSSYRHRYARHIAHPQTRKSRKSHTINSMKPSESPTASELVPYSCVSNPCRQKRHLQQSRSRSSNVNQ